MDPSKAIGIIKEQVELENISRRRYPDKWGKLTDKDVNRFYNQNEVNKDIRNSVRCHYQETWPCMYTGHGESYFVSKDMFQSLVAKCRCGRKRTEGHTIKCLQRVQSKYLNGGGSDDNDRGASVPLGDGTAHKGILTKDNHNSGDDSDQSLESSNQHTQSRIRIPATSNGMIGWPRSHFREWEQSAKYVSPVATMSGYKVTQRPYSVIFIG